MDHSHSHHHHHGHHEHINYNKAFAFGVILNSAYVLVEFFFGLRTNSLSLLSDAGHNLSDVLSLLLAWAGEYLVKRKAFGQFTYGLKRSSILIAFANTLLLMLALGGITWEAIIRLRNPQASEGMTMAVVASIGILINGFTAYLFYNKGNKQDVNIRGAFLHMASDALVSAGVVVAGIVIYFSGYNWLDPILSLVIVAVILSSTWNLLKDSGTLILDAAPSSVDVNSVKEYLLSLEGVTAIHDLHVWNLSTRQTALTVHLISPLYQADDRFLKRIEHDLHDKFEITHTTIQIENALSCNLEKTQC